MKDLTDAQIYYINLDIRKDRKKNFESQDALKTMPPVERVSATHGLSVNVKTNEKISLNTRVQLATQFRRSHYEIHSRGAIGASRSHYETWKRFLKSKSNYALIMEDDALLPPTFSMMIHDSAKDLPPTWDIWIIGWNFNPSDNTHKNASPFRQVIHFLGAHCYIINRRAAKYLIQEMFPIENHIEYFISNVAFIHGLRIVRDIRLHMPQMDRILNISDVRKPDGCPACILDDKDQAIEARRLNLKT
jgi:GR25 family glycosyltransferase involved in LPS biosynthesis